MLAPLIKRTRRKKYNNNNVQKLHFISAHFSLFNKFADKRADSAQQQQKQHAQNERLKAQTWPLDPNDATHNAYVYTKFLPLSRRKTKKKTKAKFQFGPTLPHTERKSNLTNQKNDCHGYGIIIGAVFLSPISNGKSMGRKTKNQEK